MRKAETLVKDPDAFSFVESRLFGNPAPQEADLEKAVKLSGKNSFQCMNSLYSQMMEGSEILEYISASFKELIFEYSLENNYTRIKNIFITSGLFAKLFFIAQAGLLLFIENPVYEPCADEKERENIVNIYRGLWGKLDKKYTPPLIEDFWTLKEKSYPREAPLLSHEIGINESEIPGLTKKYKKQEKVSIYHGDYVGYLKASKTANMVKMGDPVPYGTLPGKSRLKKKDHKFD
ncbi:MAG: hypothetical protein NT166_25280 [Candidatus Aminicenantes bacterium]|nr:hypothetical protein [Candidatus Aminicenantes bacterium]